MYIVCIFLYIVPGCLIVPAKDAHASCGNARLAYAGKQWIMGASRIATSVPVCMRMRRVLVHPHLLSGAGGVDGHWAACWLLFYSPACIFSCAACAAFSHGSGCRIRCTMSGDL